MAPPRASVVGIPTACRGGTATGPWRTRAPVAVLIRLPAMGRHKLLWEPSAERIERATITRFARTVGHEGGYDDLWRWSVEDLEGLWAAVWDFFDVRASAPYQRVLGRREMPGAQWFPGGRGLAGGARRRARAAALRAGRLRPSAVGALQLGHARPAEADRARPGRDAARAAQAPLPAPRRPRGRP